MDGLNLTALRTGVPSRVSCMIESPEAETEAERLKRKDRSVLVCKNVSRSTASSVGYNIQTTENQKDNLFLSGCLFWHLYCSHYE